MKKLLIPIALMTALPATAQNGGQSNSNSRCAISQPSCETDSVWLVNKQSCNANYNVSVRYGTGGWVAMDDIVISANDSIYTNYFPAQEVRIKPTDNCGTTGGDMGWLEMEICYTPLADYILAFKMTGQGIYWHTTDGMVMEYSKDCKDWVQAFEMEKTEGVWMPKNTGFYRIECNGEYSNIIPFNTANTGQDKGCYGVDGKPIDCDATGVIIISGGRKYIKI